MRRAAMLTWNKRVGGDHRATRARDFDLVGVTVRVHPDDPIDDFGSMATGRVSPPEGTVNVGTGLDGITVVADL
jgi:hypothetical protein